MDLDLIRAGTGHIRGLLRAPLSVGDQQTDLTAEADWTVGSDARLNIRLTSFRPAGVGSLPPALAFMARIDVPVSLAATVGFDALFRPDTDVGGDPFGRGQIEIGRREACRSAAAMIALSGTPDEITVTRGHFDVAHSPDRRSRDCRYRRNSQHAKRTGFRRPSAIGLNQIDIADLPRLWPPGVGGDARPWVTEM